ncbi:MAG: leucine-rich repeat domain-containing protein [Firmicutes bacterium]|nr:leucine-rich repeat domain-containing protein [Bacillota bacterium]
MKKLLSITCAFVIMSIFVGCGNSGLPKSYLLFEENDDGYTVRLAVPIFDLLNDMEIRTLVIPGEHKDKPVTAIGVGAFVAFINLEKVSIPGTVTSIGELAFFSCPELKSVNISQFVTDIGFAAFARCAKLQSITVAPANPEYKSVDGVLFGKNGKILYTCPAGKTGDYIVPDGVISIYRQSFDGAGIKTVTIAESVEYIGDDAFNGCEALTKLTLGSKVFFIGEQAFEKCRALTEITIHAATPPHLASATFKDVPSSCIIRVPAGSKSAYQSPTAFGWDKFTNIVEM